MRQSGKQKSRKFDRNLPAISLSENIAPLSLKIGGMKGRHLFLPGWLPRARGRFIIPEAIVEETFGTRFALSPVPRLTGKIIGKLPHVQPGPALVTFSQINSTPMQKKTSASSSCAATAALTIGQGRLAVLGPIRWECEILQWLEEGMNDGDITKNLSLSPRTAENGVGQVFEKLIVRTRAAVVNDRYSIAFSAPFQLSTPRRNSRATGDNPPPINPLERRGKRIPQKRKHR